MTIQEAVASLRATETARSQVFGDNDSSVVTVRQIREAVERLQEENEALRKVADELASSVSVMVENWHSGKQTTSRTINLARERLKRSRQLRTIAPVLQMRSPKLSIRALPK